MQNKILIITNGDSAVSALEKAGFSADFLPWRDVLHDGPVPANLTLEELSLTRSKFISDWGWGEYDNVVKDFQERDSRLKAFKNYEEVILWFEHDLYDQLQLIQLLDWFSQQELEQTRLCLICKDEFVSYLKGDKLMENFASQQAVMSDQLVLGHQAWLAFCSPNPQEIVDFRKQDTSCFPYLEAAFLRFLQEFPDHVNGLSRNQSQILQIAQANINLPGEMFQASQEMEDVLYLGDGSFWQYLYDMIHCDYPLLQTESNFPFSLPTSINANDEALQQRLKMTDLGLEVMQDQVNWIQKNGINKWLGGVHLTNDSLWYWDNNKQILIKKE